MGSNGFRKRANDASGDSNQCGARGRGGCADRAIEFGSKLGRRSSDDCAELSGGQVHSSGLGDNFADIQTSSEIGCRDLYGYAEGARIGTSAINRWKFGDLVNDIRFVAGAGTGKTF